MPRWVRVMVAFCTKRKFTAWIEAKSSPFSENLQEPESSPPPAMVA